MTVCLTGDVHHMSMGTRDQAYLDRTEVEVAIEYAEIAAEYDVPVTLFLTGRAAVEEPARVEHLAAMDNVEIGGHNYWAFTTPVHKVWRAFEKVTGSRIGSWNGPKPFQRYEIRRTIKALTERGADVTAWRDHAYRHDRHTAALLADEGVTHFSDVVGPDERVREENGVTVVPINTPPDHEHVYHAFRTPSSVSKSDFEGPFGTKSYFGDGWFEWIVDELERHEEKGMTATVLAHPSCMQLTDELKTFQCLCETVSDGTYVSAV